MDRISPPAQASTSRVRPASFPWGEVALQLGRRWWQRHPANAAAHVAQPALARLAATHPATLIAGAAAVGGLVVLLRPWRLLSITTVAAALLKSSDVADWVTLLASSDFTDKNKDTTSAPRKDRR